jgi:hypothetical protein
MRRRVRGDTSMCHNLLLPDSPACSVRRSHAADSDKENISDDEVKPKKKHCNQLLEIVQQCNATDVKRLRKAREVNEKQHVELQQLQ